MNNLQWNLTQNTKIFFQEDTSTFQNVCKMVTILIRPQWVNYFDITNTDSSKWKKNIIMRHINTLRLRWHEQHFADNIFKCIFSNKNVWIAIRIWLKIVHKGPINNIPALVHIMAWHRPGHKPLSEPMMVSLPASLGLNELNWITPETNQLSFQLWKGNFVNWRW